MNENNPPWQNSDDHQCTLHDDIKRFCHWISPTKEEAMMRESVIVRIACLVSTLWPTVQVKTYGSYATQLYLPNSDIDLCVLGVPGDTEQALLLLADTLRERSLSTELQVIATARVPIIRLIDGVSGATVDISLNQDVRTNQLISDYILRYPELRPMALLLKYFLYQRHLHGSFNGGLSSYNLIIVLISFLQFHVNEKQSNGCIAMRKSNLGDLLIRFFKFYGTTFDYEYMGISISNGGGFFPKMSRNWYDPFNPCSISIESPLEPGVDLGRGTFAAIQVRAAFEDAYMRLTVSPRLSTIINLDPAVLLRRQQIISLYTRTPVTPPPTPPSTPVPTPPPCVQVHSRQRSNPRQKHHPKKWACKRQGQCSNGVEDGKAVSLSDPCSNSSLLRKILIVANAEP